MEERLTNENRDKDEIVRELNLSKREKKVLSSCSQGSIVVKNCKISWVYTCMFMIVLNKGNMNVLFTYMFTVSTILENSVENSKVQSAEKIWLNFFFGGGRDYM